MKTVVRFCVFFTIIMMSCLWAVASETGTIGHGYAPGDIPQPAGPVKEVSQTGRYIIKLIEPPLATYRGGIGTLQATSPKSSGHEKIDMSSDAAEKYFEYLESRRNVMVAAIENNLGRSLHVLRTYRVVYNGIAVEMTGQEAARVAKLPGVAAVLPDIMQYPHTDNGPTWIGADDIWNGISGTATWGEGVVIGVIDTGINPANRSFADIGDDGYDHSNPKGKYYGFCDPASSHFNAGFLCNDKLIGAYDFARDSGDPVVLFDNDGHGSHTASTAGGNVVLSTVLNAPTITLNRDISGVAPHANIISYKACRDGCQGNWLLAAIDQAVADGVDVINYSIGGGASDPWLHPSAEAFLNARQAGVFVAASAGNNGPDSETLGSPGNAPWLLTVGSSSHDRRFDTSLTNLTSTGGPLAAITGKSVSGVLSARDIVYAGDAPYNNPLCAGGVWGAGTFSGQIVVCDRGTYGRVAKGQNVQAAGGGGYILANDAANGYGINSDSHVLPAVHITYNDGVALKNWLAAGSNHQAAITATIINVADANGDIMSSFSSRGSNITVPGVLKPDVSAPGQDIFAAHGVNNVEKWDVISGTSMASPHAAGAAALLVSQHPTWSPAIIQSALITSADSTVLKEDGITAADPFDTGAGRIDISRTTKAGIVFDESYTDFLAANPSAGGDPSALNLAGLGTDQAVWSYSWKRTARSTMGTSVTWTASVNNPAGVALTVTPPSFALSAGGSQELTITANVSGAVMDTWLFGAVSFTPDTGQTVTARMPLSLKSVASNLPQELRYSGVYRRSSEILTNIQSNKNITELSTTPYGMTAATVHEEKLYQDPTPGNPYDPGVGMVEKVVNVPSGSKRLVAEIVATTAPDMDMHMWRWTGSAWEWICSATTLSSLEYCSAQDPVAGEYHIYVQNWAATDPSGTTPDDVTFTTAVVPASDAGNLRVALTTGSTVPTGQPFDLALSWQLSGKELHWYGAFDLGSDSSHPDNLGRVDLNLTNVEDNKAFFIIKGKDGKIFVIRPGQ